MRHYSGLSRVGSGPGEVGRCAAPEEMPHNAPVTHGETKIQHEQRVRKPRARGDDCSSWEGDASGLPRTGHVSEGCRHTAAPFLAGLGRKSLHGTGESRVLEITMY